MSSNTQNDQSNSGTTQLAKRSRTPWVIGVGLPSSSINTLTESPIATTAPCASLTMVYTMVSEAQGAVVAIGDSVNVFIDDEGKPTPMTQGVRDRFASWVVPELD